MALVIMRSIKNVILYIKRLQLTAQSCHIYVPHILCFLLPVYSTFYDEILYIRTVQDLTKYFVVMFPSLYYKVKKRILQPTLSVNI